MCGCNVERAFTHFLSAATSCSFCRQSCHHSVSLTPRRGALCTRRSSINADIHTCHARQQTTCVNVACDNLWVQFVLVRSKTSDTCRPAKFNFISRVFGSVPLNSYTMWSRKLHLWWIAHSVAITMSTRHRATMRATWRNYKRDDPRQKYASE
jgi:hypothetical protein